MTYREPGKPRCKHERLLNRGCPPNASNQRTCGECRKRFLPPEEPGGTCKSPDDGEEVPDR